MSTEAPVTPKQIFAELSRDVIGQDEALRGMSVAIYKHLIGHSVGNVLMVGNSGTGKTTIMRAVERFYSTTRELAKHSTIIRINANLVADLASRGRQTNIVMDRLAHQAASILGIGERTLYRKLKQYGLQDVGKKTWRPGHRREDNKTISQ